MINGIKPPRANGMTSMAAVTTKMMIVMAAGINHSLESRKLTISRRRHLNQRLIGHPEVGEDAGCRLLIKIADAGLLPMGPGEQIVRNLDALPLAQVAQLGAAVPGIEAQLSKAEDACSVVG